MKRLLVILTPFACLSLLIVSCLTHRSSAVANRNPIGEAFPRVNGESLAGKKYSLPDDMKGKPALFLIGYEQETQFDIDRWLLGLTQLKTPVSVFEVPTLPGLAPRVISAQIDDGMRRGIPKEDWGVVITVYGDASRIRAFTGNSNPNNGRIVLLDAEGKVVWFHDRGYSAAMVAELDQKVRSISATQ